MRLVRTTAAVVLMVTYIAASAPGADSASPIGNGFCDLVSQGDGDFCIGKNDSGAPWADWTGENTILVFNDWRYFVDSSDSPNDDGEFAINGDTVGMLLFEDPNLDDPHSCIPIGYVNSDMMGRENNDSSLTPLLFGDC